MLLKTCLEIGKDCGFDSIESCYDNIYHHAMNIFRYEDINKEILELQKDIFFNDADEFCRIFDSDKNNLISKGWITKDSSIKKDE